MLQFHTYVASGQGNLTKGRTIAAAHGLFNRRWAYQQSYSTSGPVSTGMGDRLRRINHLSQYDLPVTTASAVGRDQVQRRLITERRHEPYKACE